MMAEILQGSRRRPVNSRQRLLMIIGVTAIAVSAVTAGIWFVSSGPARFQGGESTIGYSSFVHSDFPPLGVTVVNETNSIYINRSGVTIFIESTPPWANRSGDFFECYGLVNPELHIRPGLAVTFALVNADDEEHDLVISVQSPPYQYMPMMNSGMMWGQHSWMYGTPMLGGINGNITQGTQIPVMSLQLDIQNPGTYWYFCGYPGHAESGMYGEIAVG